jgi:hypothetical protein
VVGECRHDAEALLPFPIQLGDGTGAVGSPTYDLAPGYLYAGSEDGVVYAIQVP